MDTFEPIKLTEIIVEEVGTPRNDGTPGSALYKVPIRLSAVPPREWAEIFIAVWDNPPEFTTMHRPGTASVAGDRVILNRTTLDEIKQYHRKTLLLVVEETNKKYLEYLSRQKEAMLREQERISRHQDEVKRKAGDIRFD